MRGAVCYPAGHASHLSCYSAGTESDLCTHNRDSKIKCTFSACSHASHLYCYSVDTESDLSTTSSDSKISYPTPIPHEAEAEIMGTF